MTDSSGGIDFDGWLESQLAKTLGGQSGQSPLASQATYHAAHIAGGAAGMSFFSSIFSSITAAVTSKLVIAGATGLLIVGGGTLVAATAASGSPNPINWGAIVTRAVEDCKDLRATGVRGIGSCVASIAREHGVEVASAARDKDEDVNHEASAARQHKGHEQASEARENKGHEEASEARENHAGHQSDGDNADESTNKPAQHGSRTGPASGHHQPASPGGSHD